MRDTVPCGIPCLVGIPSRAAWDTMRLRCGRFRCHGAQSRRRCGRGEPSPGADVAGASPVPAQMWLGIFPRMRPTRPAARGFSAPCARARRLRSPHTLREPTVLSGYRITFTVPTAPSECPQYPHLLGLLDDIVDQVHDDAYLDPGLHCIALHCTALHCTAWHGNRSRDAAN